METKTAYIGIRCPEAIKTALERAAEADGRTLTNLLNRELALLIAAKGWDKPPPKNKRRTKLTEGNTQ